MIPVVGEWYQIDGSQKFEVVSYDEEAGVVEVQYADGTVDEIDYDEWEDGAEDGKIELTTEADDDDEDDCSTYDEGDEE